MGKRRRVPLPPQPRPKSQRTLSESWHAAMGDATQSQEATGAGAPREHSPARLSEMFSDTHSENEEVAASASSQAALAPPLAAKEGSCKNVAASASGHAALAPPLAAKEVAASGSSDAAVAPRLAAEEANSAAAVEPPPTSRVFSYPASPPANATKWRQQELEASRVAANYFRLIDLFKRVDTRNLTADEVTTLQEQQDVSQERYEQALLVLYGRQTEMEFFNDAMWGHQCASWRRRLASLPKSLPRGQSEAQWKLI